MCLYLQEISTVLKQCGVGYNLICCTYKEWLQIGNVIVSAYGEIYLFVYVLINESSGEQTSSKRSSRRYKKRNNPISIRRGPLFDRSGAKATPCCFSLELTSVVDSFSNSATLQQQSTIKIYFSFVWLRLGVDDSILASSWETEQ